MPLNNTENIEDIDQDQNLEEFDIEELEENIGAFNPEKINGESDIPASYAKNAIYQNYLAGNLAQEPVDKYSDYLSTAKYPFERQFERQQRLDYKLSNLNHRTRIADPYSGARAGTYNARHDGANFERYYSHTDSGLYQELGFSPYRNNEELYNANTSGYKEWQRANDHWWTIFKAGYKNYFNSYTGAGGTMYADLGSAEEMERAMAIGMSTKEGVGPAVSNFFLNSATTFGMLGAFATEGAVITAAGVVMGASSGGAGALPFAARLGYGLNKLRTGVRTIRAAGTTRQGAYSIYESLKALNNIKNARTAWKYTKNVAGGIGRSINPLQGTMNAYRILRDGRKVLNPGLLRYGVKKTENVKDFITGFYAFGEMARDVRAINLAHSESRLEAGLVANEVSKNRYAEYYTSLKPGERVDSEKLKTIREDVAKASIGTYWRNLGVIYATNKIVMRGIISPYRSAALNKTLTGRIGRSGYEVIKEGGKNVVKKSRIGLLAPFTKQFWRPKSLLGNAFRYTSRNWAEGAQELYQEGLAAGMNMYYGSAATSADAGAFTETIRKGFKSMYSTQGLEIFLNGFAMGGLIGVGHSTYQTGATHIPRMSKSGRENYEQQKEDEQKAEEMLTNMINDPISYLKVLDSNPLFQANIAKEMDEAQQVGDKKSFLDFKKSAEFKHIITAIKSGALPLFIQDLEGYNDFTDNELLEAFSDSFTESEKKDLDIRSKINNIIEKAKNLEHYYNYIEERYGNGNFDRDQYVKESPEWYLESYKMAAFENYKMQVIFMNEAYKDILERKEDIFNKLGFAQSKLFGLTSKGMASNLKDASLTELNAMLDIPSLVTEINTLEQEIAIVEDSDIKITKEQRKKLKDSKKKLIALEEYREALSKINYYRKQLELLNKSDISIEDLEKLPENERKIIENFLGKFKDKTKNDFENEIKTGIENIENSFYKYIELIENINNKKANKDLTAEIIEMIIDYNLMEGEAQNLQLASDILTSPQGLEKFMTEHTAYLEYLYNRKDVDMAEARRKFEASIKTNDIFNELFLAGFYIDPVFYPALKQGLDVKIPFYYTNKPLKSDEAVVENPDDLQKIYDILRKYYKARGFKVESYPDYIKTKEELRAEEKETPSATTTTTTTEEEEISLLDREFEQLPEDLQKEIEGIIDRMIKNSEEEEGWLEANYGNKLGFIKAQIAEQKTAGSGDIYSAITNYEKKSAKVKPTESDTAIAKKQKELDRLDKLINDPNTAEKLKKSAEKKKKEIEKDLEEYRNRTVQSEDPGKEDIEPIETKEIKVPNFLNEEDMENIYNASSPISILKGKKDSDLIKLVEGQSGTFKITINDEEFTISITNTGHQTFNEFKEQFKIITIDEAMKRFNFPTTKKGDFIHEINIDGKKYYVNSETLQEWFNNPNTKLTRYNLKKVTIKAAEVESEDIRVFQYIQQLSNTEITEKQYLKLREEITDPINGIDVKYLDEKEDIGKLLIKLDNEFGKSYQPTATKKTKVQKNKIMIYNGVSKILGKGPLQVTVLSTTDKKATVQFDAIDGPKTATVSLKSLSEMKAEEPVVVTPEDKNINDESKKVNDDIAGSEVISKAEELSKQGKSLDELEAEMIKKNKEDNENCE